MRTRILVVCIVFVTSAVFATLYKWPQNKRPLIPIDEAYSKALAELHAKAGAVSTNYYCINAFLTGNKEQDGKEGVWNFSFDSENKAPMDVYVSMDGNVSME